MCKKINVLYVHLTDFDVNEITGLINWGGGQYDSTFALVVRIRLHYLGSKHDLLGISSQ